jgi:RNA-directed DNA polymerase
MRLTMRRWQLHHRNDLALDEVAAWVRQVVTGWMNYYGRFQRSALIPVFRPLDSFPAAVGTTQIPKIPESQEGPSVVP